jgi:hypothetical protein
MSPDIAEDRTLLEQRLEDADCNAGLGDLSIRHARLKWKLKRAVEAKAELDFEEQRVQARLPLMHAVCSYLFKPNHQSEQLFSFLALSWIACINLYCMDNTTGLPSLITPLLLTGSDAGGNQSPTFEA